MPDRVFGITKEDGKKLQNALNLVKQLTLPKDGISNLSDDSYFYGKRVTTGPEGSEDDYSDDVRIWFSRVFLDNDDDDSTTALSWSAVDPADPDYLVATASNRSTTYPEVGQILQIFHVASDESPLIGRYEFIY